MTQLLNLCLCTCQHMCQHPHTYHFGSSFFHCPRLRQCWTLSLCTFNSSSTQATLFRHFWGCCPTAESSCGSKTKQGVAALLPACPQLSPHCNTVRTALQMVLSRWHAEIRVYCTAASYHWSVLCSFADNGGHTLDAAYTTDAFLMGCSLANSDSLLEIKK